MEMSQVLEIKKSAKKIVLRDTEIITINKNTLLLFTVNFMERFQSRDISRVCIPKIALKIERWSYTSYFFEFGKDIRGARNERLLWKLLKAGYWN